MIARNEKKSACLRLALARRHASAKRKQVLCSRPSFLILKWALAAWVLASLLFAHGCHGNQDHELFDAIEWVSGE